MKVRVKYTGQLRTAVGRSEDEFEMPGGGDLVALLRRVAAKLGEEAAPHLVSPNGAIPRTLLVVLNEQAVAVHAADEAVLQDGDILTLLPPIAGG